METSVLSSKGQIIIPKPIRDAHHWRPGTEMIVESVADGILLRPRSPFPPTQLEAGLGCAGYSGPAKTQTEMDQGLREAIQRAWGKAEEP